MDINDVEANTLATFTKHRPSEYFSHIGSKKSFAAHHEKVELLYRFGLTMPPEFFLGKSVIDLGAGTGEHTISLAKWGAICTLVEMNSEAVEVSKRVFEEHTNNFKEHKFIKSSLYDIDLDFFRESYDISHSRGVFTHVADKPRAFQILATMVKRGGYIIYGDRNTVGGIQEMLQRFAIYHLGGDSDEKIIEVAEALFSEDIDRSQKSVPRTREAIIFDRWVIQQQDDPSVNEVLAYFEQEGIEYVSSWPRIDFPGRGTSTFSDPRNSAALKKGAVLIENLWMILNKGELENISSSNFVEDSSNYFEDLGSLSHALRNIKIGTTLSVEALIEKFHRLGSRDASTHFSSRLDTFFREVELFLRMIENRKDPLEIRREVNKFQILFRGYVGVRHVDYVGYKPL